MSVIKNLKVFMTPPHPCSYLEGREATTLFVDPNARIDADTYAELNEIGFRRSGEHFYTPHCRNCRDCIATRIPVARFEAARKHRRIWNRNSDLEVHSTASIDSDEHYALYRRYIESRHDEGDMYPPDRNQYRDFICSAGEFGRFTEFRQHGELLAVSIADAVRGGLSAIYTFFEPEAHRRSLGSFAILYAIEAVRQQDGDYVYLGYWIRNCRKMAYKIDFRPIELYIDGRWQLLR